MEKKMKASSNNTKSRGPDLQAAGLLKQDDIIQVPVENCRVVDTLVIPGQMFDRESRLVSVKVTPLSGPWGGVEGVFVINSNVPLPVVQFSKRPSRLYRFLAKLFSMRILSAFLSVFKNKQQGRISDPQDTHSLTGPMT